MAKCAKCGGEMKDTAKFCPGCGAKAEARPQSRSCGKCGGPLRETAKFCPACGAACGTAAGAAPAPAAPAKSAPPPKPAAAKPAARSAGANIPGFVFVQGGSFVMGSVIHGGDEVPEHTVTVSSFYMGVYPVTQKEYAAVIGSNPSHFKGASLPVERVTWFDAVEYCNKRSQKEGLTPAYTVSGSGDKRKVSWNRNVSGYRLPTEAEWEYAAKGGGKGGADFEYAGSDNADEVAWYEDNSREQTHPVGQKKPNSLGLYDMSGNVWEWCWDWYGAYPSAPQTDPVGASSGSYRVSRGGSWGGTAAIVRSAFRGYDSPSDRYNNLGFRLVRP